LDPGFGGGDGIVMVRIPRTRATAEAVELLADGRILIGSQLVRIRRNRKAPERPAGLALTLLSPAGEPDPTFGSGGIRRAPGLFADLAVDDHGIVVMGVDRKRPARMTLARYTFGGISDETFAPGGRVERSFGKRVEVYDGEVLFDAAGRFVVSITGISRRCFFGYGAVARLNADGSWDRTFSGDGVAARGCRSWPQLAIQRDGKIVAAGEIFGGAGSGEYIPVMARVGADGGLDPSFGSEGIITSMPPDPTPKDDAGELYFAATEDVVLQPDGKIVLLAQAIWEYSFALGRFHAA
jgi:uncharacterized delta-60 repeat protein